LSKLTIRVIPLLVLLLLGGVKQASAQGMSAYFGLGSAINGRVTSPGCPPQQISDPFNSAGPPASCETAPTMGGVFGVFGADLMFTPHLGMNGEYSFRFAQASYLPSESLNVRPAFYDFNLIYQPGGDSHVVPVLEGGIGGSKLSFYFTQQSNVFNQSQFVASSNHFQVHGAAGMKIYINSIVFIKPQLDLRWVDHLNNQYKRNFVPEYTVSIGYTFGRR